MTVLLVGAALLSMLFCAQLLLWRLWRPVRQIRALLIVFVLAPLIGLAGLFLAGRPHGVAALSDADFVRIILFYVSCSLAYIILYSAIEERSPTLTILAYVAEKRECSEAELFARFGKGDELAGRLVLLIQSQLVGCSGDICRLTKSGRRFAQLFEAASRLFGLESGG